jgi:hypothetical protein
MKIDVTVTITPEELNQYVLEGLKSAGKPLPDDVLLSVKIAQPPTPILPGTVLRGKATIFGLNYDGSNDTGDMNPDGTNMTGFFIDPLSGKNYETHNRTLVGAAVPERILLASLSLTGSWKENASHVLEWHKANKPIVRVWGEGGQGPVDAFLVDVGPAETTGAILDRTFGLCTALGEHDNKTNSYSILVGGTPIPLKMS